MTSLATALLVSSLAVVVATALLSAVAKPVSRRLGILDTPHGRKIHSESVPYLGGVAMFLGLAAGMAFFAFFRPDEVMLHRPELTGILIGGVFVCLVGLWDDVRGAKALPKLACEVAIALFMWNQGLRVERITLPTGATFFLTPEGMAGLETWKILAAEGLSLLITVAWYVLLMNAINLIDGLDGLAAGISLIVALVVVGTALAIYVQPPVAALAIGAFTAAACLGFLFHNWHPASIFMGDCGALLLGFLLASIALLSSTKAPALLTLLIPLLAIGLPIVESIHAFFRRLVARQNPFQADRRHLHHRLLDLGLSHRRVVMTLLYITAFLGLMSFILAGASPVVSVLAVLLLGGGFLVLLENITALEKNGTKGGSEPSASRGSKESSGASDRRKPDA
jgi:UDP-GlcNAc:undecaprenyl-phosphate GlcNAc-1-phosphate transferase